MAKEYTCGFKYCSHENKKVPEGEAIKSGTRYFHKDCLRVRDNMDAVKRIYYENISNTVVIAQLVKVIQTIVINKGVDSEFLLFAIKYAVAKKMTIRSPYGLHYLIDNAMIKNAWNAKQAKEEKQKITELAKLQPRESEVTFTVAKRKKEGFDSIFGGG